MVKEDFLFHWHAAPEGDFFFLGGWQMNFAQEYLWNY